jgi:type VI secretion system protein ImpL
MFGAGSDPALVWREDQGRLVLSPQRLALRDALTALLQEPFMVPPADRVIPTAAAEPLSWDTQRLQQALAMVEERRRFASNNLPMFPPAVRQSIAQFVDAHLAQLVQDATVEAISPGHASSVGPSDLAAYRAQREQLSKVQALLADLGARGRADKLRALLSQDLLDRVALAETALWRTSIYSDRTLHFGWWQGEGSPILQAFGVVDKLALRYALSQQLGHIEEISREAAGYLAYADAGIASNPTVLRWQGMVGELKRYRSGAADSSLLALERYLLSVGAELNRSNCVERLSFATPASGGADEFAQRHVQIHKALLGRCIELRSPARMTDPARPVTPFG